MMRILKIVFIFALAALSCSCVKYDLEEILLDRSDISLTWKGDDQVVYDPLTFQLGYNDRRHEYRVNDDSMANYFVATFSAKPSSEGQDLTGNVEWTISSNIKRYEGVRFTVKKIGADGTVWLWSRNQKIGLVVKEIE